MQVMPPLLRLPHSQRRITAAMLLGTHHEFVPSDNVLQVSELQPAVHPYSSPAYVPAPLFAMGFTQTFTTSLLPNQQL
jgi:hypothetical protein